MSSPHRRRPISYVLSVACLIAGVSLAAGAPAAPGAGPSGGGSPGGVRAFEQKLDPFLRRLVLGVPRTRGILTDRLPPRSRAALATLPPFVRATRAAADPILFVNARVGAGAGLEAILAAGAQLRGRAGDIVSLAVPLSALEAVAARPEVRWLRAARSFTLMNDISTGDPHTQARLQNSTFGATGAGVIVAVVDTGIDYTNLDMQHLDGTTRVLGIWDQTITDPAHPPPPGFAFGAWYSQADINSVLALGTELLTQDGHGHGTHVAGTAAGNGSDTGNGIPAGTFAGMAPEADLLIVRVFDNSGTWCDNCDLVAAVQFIDQFAQAVGEPWVGNMSLGDDLGGAHDGTSADELAIDAVVGPGRPGAQLAVAAGNSGRTSQHFHWEGTLAAGQTFSNSFTLPTTNPASGADNDFVWIDAWYDGADSATVEVVTPGAATVSVPQGGDSGIVCTTSGAVHVDATNSADPENGDSQVFIEISDSSACSPAVPPATGSWTVRIVTDAVGPGGGGPFDLWNAATARGRAWVDFATFQLATSVSVPGTARNAITAGSYVSKNTWTNGDGGASIGSGTVAALSNFSGIGPTRDDRIKPDITAPGQTVGSSLSIKRAPTVFSQNRERDNRHWGISGTSMATPHVAGAIALLFDIDPTLDGAQVRAALQRSAQADVQTGALPNNRFGYGKLKALDASSDVAATPGDVVAGDVAGGFAWGDQPTVNTWNVYRAPIPGLSAADYGTCFLSGLLTPGFADPEIPALDQGFAYFVAGEYTSFSTGLPVEASLGTDSAGNIRPNIAPCP
jgi:subtilisin family serine protease